MDEHGKAGAALDAKTVQVRLRDYGLIAHMQVATMMMGGIFALAALALVDIIRSPDRPLLRITFWLLGVGTEVVALSRQMQRPLLLARASTPEIPLLVLHGVLTLTAFAIISPQTGGPDGWHYLYLLWIGIGATTWLILRTSIRSVTMQRYDEGLRAVVDTFVTHQRTFMRQLIVGLIPFSLLMFLLIHFALHANAAAEIVAGAVNLLTLAWIGYSFVQHERDFRGFEAAVEKVAQD